MSKVKALRKLVKKGITAAQKKRTKENKRIANTDPETASYLKQRKLYKSLDNKIINIKSELRKKYGDMHQKIIDSPEYRRMLNKKLTDREKALLDDRRTDPSNSGEFELFLPFNKRTQKRIKKEEEGIGKAEREAEDGSQPRFEDLEDDIPFNKGGDVVNPVENLVGKRPNKQRPAYSERMRRPNRKKTKSEKEMRKFLTGSVASEFALTPADRYMFIKGRSGTPAKKKKSKVIRKGM